MDGNFFRADLKRKACPDWNFAGQMRILWVTNLVYLTIIS